MAFILSSIAIALAMLFEITYRGCGRDGTYCPAACDRLRTSLDTNLYGQEFAVEQLADAICDHTAARLPRKPLVLSVHGPPGVGKSYFHALLAQTLYNATGETTVCPGAGCPAYKVVFGTDYISSEKDRQVHMLQEAILQHVQSYPESVIVIEEYDKMDCRSRGLFKQLMDKGFTSNSTFSKSIIVLEANVGWYHMYEMLAKSGGRTQMSMEEAQKGLKDVVFTKWKSEQCEEFVDTAKTVSLIDMFVPFLPLELPHMRSILDSLLQRRRVREIRNSRVGELRWDAEVVEWLARRAEYDGGFEGTLVEGAKEAHTIMSRHVTRALRLRPTPLPPTMMQKSAARQEGSGGPPGGGGGQLPGEGGQVPPEDWQPHEDIVQLFVSADGAAVEARTVGRLAGGEAPADERSLGGNMMRAAGAARELIGERWARIGRTVDKTVSKYIDPQGHHLDL